ncbi:late histone H2B.L4-like [Canis lupus familiaris]|uniref:late histone H2B.L4-like n=1 Tax=Canis lupus familiaris TaxID=9615 RepID=UPI00005A5EF8|nr:late histone H2B.L4-like [Canis lupus familiaris]XP_025286936.1 late histone H2B.L4-like [Canis lupus dingo]XP_038305127.1 late histone H2B.L4-like [Canis lupus familiaris]XP_038444751.1 late histone H2B.L4-like [Canis lupus familiaris]|eukprot:XP_005642171.1 late histone H2B.L4-like [Canis lupus familiaris]
MPGQEGYHSNRNKEPKAEASKAIVQPPLTQQFCHQHPQGSEQVQKGLSLLQKAVSVMHLTVKDIFERIAYEASRLARSTITSRESQTAMHLLLPGEIGKHIVSEASEAFIRYTRRQ